MADNDELDLDGGGEPAEPSGGGGGGGGAKKPSGLGALLPNLLKFVAIGLGALIFIVTVSAITVNILNTRGAAQTVIPDSSVFDGVRPLYSYYTNIGVIRTNTKDPLPYTAVVDMIIGYDLNDGNVMTELNGRQYELQDFIRNYFRGKTAKELEPENEERIKREIVELLNTRILSTGKVRMVYFRQLDVAGM